MLSFFKYHVLSGMVAAKVTVPTLDDLAVYAEYGYDFLPFVSRPEGMALWVDPATKQLMPQTTVAIGGVTLEAGIGDVITITGLPTVCWVRFDQNAPIRATGGKISFSRTIETPFSMAQLVGQYTCPLWTLAWTEIAELKTTFSHRIDADAEAARQRGITPGSGQAMTYLRKGDAARMFLAGQEIGEAQMQRLQDEATRLGVSVTDAAHALVATSDAWEALDAQIDNIRLTRKDMVEAATNGEQIRNIYSAIVWPL